MADYSINAVTRKVSYSGSAGVGPYAFTFEVLASTDVAVYKNSTPLVETTNYTVSINANGTGTVTLTSAATAADTIVIIGARDIERTTDYTAGGELTAASLNTALDAQVIFTQQVSEKADRSLKAPPYDPTTVDMTLPDLDTRKGRLLQFNSVTGNPEVAIGNDDIETLVGISADIATLADIEDGTVATDAISTLATATSQIPTVASNTAAIQAIGNDLNGAAIELDYGDLSAAANPASPTGVLGAIYDNLDTFDTLAPVVDDLGTLAGLTTEISDLSAIETEITGVYAIRTDVSSVAGIANDVTTVAADATDIGVVATDLSGSDTIGTVAGIAANVTTVAGISANVTSVAGNAANITTVAGLESDIQSVITNISAIQSAPQNAVDAEAALSSFQAVYLGDSPTQPTIDGNGDPVSVGDLYFDTTANEMRVYDGTSWAAAGSAVNGTAERVTYTATASQTTFNVTYDAGYVDVYLNGVKLVLDTDFTASSGTNIVLSTGASAGDIVDIVAYGAFELANVYTQTAADARFAQLSNNLSDLASASTARTNLGLGTMAVETATDYLTTSSASSTYVAQADIGSTVQAYDADTVKTDVAQTYTAQQTFGELKETVYTLATSGTVALDPANGSIQTCASSGPTFTDSLEAGQTLVLHVTGGDSSPVTFPTVTWVTSGGNVAPTATASDVFVFWKISTTLYGAYVGNFV